MKKVLYILVILALIGGVVWLIMTPGKAGKLDAFATCVKDSGAKFYGAFWCPHCQAQKARFGTSAKLLPYTECSTPDGQGQLQVCKDLGVNTYPTWYFSSSTAVGGYEIISGEIELVGIAEKTSCSIPE